MLPRWFRTAPYPILCVTQKNGVGKKSSHKVAIFIYVYISNQKTSVYLEPVSSLVWGEGPNSIQNKGHLCPKYIHMHIYNQKSYTFHKHMPISLDET